MPFGSYGVEEPVKVPTFLQFLKSANKAIEGKTKFGVDIVWLPGKFQNVTLQTHAFRLITSENHKLFNEIQEYFKQYDDDSIVQRLEVIVTSIEKRTFDVCEGTRNKGSWTLVGESGRKFNAL
jgi:hypothetical protein